MGLFMDADGIPLSFDLYSGNQNEQLTLQPLETKVIRDFNCSEFIFCYAAGLGSKGNSFFSSFCCNVYLKSLLFGFLPGLASLIKTDNDVASGLL